MVLMRDPQQAKIVYILKAQEKKAQEKISESFYDINWRVKYFRCHMPFKISKAAYKISSLLWAPWVLI